VSWSDRGFLATGHEILLPARSGRIDAEKVTYSQHALFANLTPRSTEGYVELDLVRKVMEVCLAVPIDKEHGWRGHFMELEWFKFLEPIGPLAPFYRNGRYRLVPQRE
jgi:hypothetical protein